MNKDIKFNFIHQRIIILIYLFILIFFFTFFIARMNLFVLILVYSIIRILTQSIGLLSYTFLSRTGHDRIVVPMVSFTTLLFGPCIVTNVIHEFSLTCISVSRIVNLKMSFG